MSMMTAEPSELPSAAVCRILVVDDEPMVAIMLEDALQEFGYQVVGPVENLRSAVQLAGSERLDAAIVDINIDGQMSDAIADKLMERGIPFIFVSGYPRTNGLRYSNVPLLRKPFSVEDLQRAIEAVLRRP
jgi:DNA-binding response OmpR family regulator